MTVTIATFYHLTPFADYAAHQAPWKAFMQERSVKGTILVTPEGINATIAGPDDGVEATLAMIRADNRFTAMPHKVSYAEKCPFDRTKVKLKKETIPLGYPVTPEGVGVYVKPADWNALIANPDTITIDTRNGYEVNLGRFKGAQNPDTRTFRDLPAWLNKRLPTDKSVPIAMYCTGGIRCEKSTAYLTQQGYRNVYHLEGGILKYLEDVPPDQSLWEGDCYVFDDRVAVDHHLQPATQYHACPTCQSPIIAADIQRAKGRNPCPVCRRREA